MKLAFVNLVRPLFELVHENFGDLREIEVFIIEYIFSIFRRCLSKSKNIWLIVMG